MDLQLAGEIAMGEAGGGSIQSGEAIRIPTGGFLPQGADAVVMQENTERIAKSNPHFEKCKCLGKCSSARRRFSKKRNSICSRAHRCGRKIYQGLQHLEFRKSKYFETCMFIFSALEMNSYLLTETKLQTGMIRETNSLSLANAASKFGFDSEVSGIFIDEFDVQRNALEKAMKDADVVLISGGSSVGDRDYTLQVIQSFADHKIYFHGLAIRPGNPTIFATIGNRSIFGLPGTTGFFIGCFLSICFAIFVSSLRRENRLFHFSRFQLRIDDVHLLEPIHPLKTKTDYVRLRIFQ